ncbi:hypothetical protein Poli38472_008968 [Pythium oligandrum]|uniref:Uncharacterized protein n=1 Tax=Pythium oligandrum TaxID=41045 RepID=A0A8K1FJD5_PYTOL|nr:hypothetical protein Poli38472_008968 [Pythium oligandrum]|eukprot:TMW64801.1 hypothetical protein Poli38472_008968 [Pythium oligandrum]
MRGAPRELLLRAWDASAACGVLRSSPETAQWREIPGDLGVVVTFNPAHRAMRGHLLSIFDLAALRPQVLSLDLLQWALGFLSHVDDVDFALGFNSAGAWSSVNHAHFQGFWLDEVLGPNKQFPVVSQPRDELFRFRPGPTRSSVAISSIRHWPMHCLAIEPAEKTQLDALAAAVWLVVSKLQQEDIPHNLLLVWKPTPVVFVFPRQAQRISTLQLPVDSGDDSHQCGQLQFAVAEVAGLLVAGDEPTFRLISEESFCRILKQDVSLTQITRDGSGMGSACSSNYGIVADPNVLSLAHYEVHRVIGQGGFGKVNAVIRKKTSPPQWFAIKTLSKEVILKKHCVKMVWNERNLLSTIKSPHIVMMHHAFQDDANCYVVMDLLLGGDLKFHLTSTRFRSTGFKEEPVRFYIAGLLLALEHLHSRNILHRDIKPDNVILDNQGYPRLTDLGISVKTEALRHRGNSGTTSYMAPELFVASTEHGAAADLFSLGVMMFELLCCRRPFSGGVKATVEAHPEFLDALPDSRAQEYYPTEVLDGSPSSPISLPGRDLLRGLLHPSEKYRLGYQRGVDEVRQHEWFKGFDWKAYEAKTMAAPFTPTIDENKANCDTAAQDFDDVLDRSSRTTVVLKPEERQEFEGFEFNVDITGKGVAPAP